MAVTINSPVRFYYNAAGETLPEQLDNNTIYFDENYKVVQIGNIPIANYSTLPDNLLTTLPDQQLSIIEKINVKTKLGIDDAPIWQIS